MWQTFKQNLQIRFPRLFSVVQFQTSKRSQVCVLGQRMFTHTHILSILPKSKKPNSAQYCVYTYVCNICISTLHLSIDRLCLIKSFFSSITVLWGFLPGYNRQVGRGVERKREREHALSQTKAENPVASAPDLPTELHCPPSVWF